MGILCRKRNMTVDVTGLSQYFPVLVDRSRKGYGDSNRVKNCSTGPGGSGDILEASVTQLASNRPPGIASSSTNCVSPTALAARGPSEPTWRRKPRAQVRNLLSNHQVPSKTPAYHRPCRRVRQIAHRIGGRLLVIAPASRR